MDNNPSNLLQQKRFQPPEGWDWSFRTLRGMKIRYGQVRTRKRYRAIVAMFEGLGDFGEQYFELAHDLDARGFKLVIIDPPGQGGSSRYLPNPHKRHCDGFDNMLADLHTIVDEIVLSAAVDPEDNHKRLPIILLAHSMGGHLALRYLSEYNRSSRGTKIFCAAAMTAPMVAIRAVENVPAFIRPFIAAYLRLIKTRYVFFGSDWFDGYRIGPNKDIIYSTDSERNQLQSAYYLNPEYQHLVVGSPTNKWLLDAIASCEQLKKNSYLEKIDIPVLAALAEQDLLVSNNAMKKAIARIPMGKLMEIQGAHHEILMETDAYRGVFLDRFFTFIEDNVLNKPDEGKTIIQ